MDSSYEYLQRFRKLLSLVNPEPVLLCFGIHTGIVMSVLQPFYYWRRCTELYWKQFDDIDNFCRNLANPNYTEYHEHVEQDVAQMTIYFALANTLPLLISSPLLAAWSDSGGRIRPLLLATTFTCVGYVPLLVLTVDIYISTYWLMSALLIFGIGGQEVVATASCFSMITDEARKSDDNRRVSARVAVGAAAAISGQFLGCSIALLFGQFPALRNYYTAMLVAQIGLAFACLYVAFVATETLEIEETPERPVDRNTWKVMLQAAREYCALVAERLKGAVLTVTKPRPGKRRFCLVLTLTLNMLLKVCFAGTAPLMLLYVKLPQFNWSDSDFVYYRIFLLGMMSLGLFMAPLLIKQLSWVRQPDTLMIIAAATASFFLNVTTGLSPVTWMLYAAALLYMVISAGIPGVASLYSKLVTGDETARIFTLSGIVESMCGFVGTFVFSNVYSATVGLGGGRGAGFSFLLAAFLHLPVIAGFIYIHVLMLREDEDPHLLSAEVSSAVETASESNLHRSSSDRSVEVY